MGGSSSTSNGHAHGAGAANGAADGKAVKDISRTRLANYESAFDAFLRKLEGSIRAEKVRAARPGMRAPRPTPPHHASSFHLRPPTPN